MLPMLAKQYILDKKKINYFTGATLRNLGQAVDRKNSVIITDEHLWRIYQSKLKAWKTIVIPAGEEAKQAGTVWPIFEELITLGADRTTTVVGLGGGVVTDIAGFVASTYLRGVPLGLVPTTLLNLCDASIGGKNGLDLGLYKNMVGAVYQPDFIFQDLSLLDTLPEAEWVNGFAEIIKHAFIADPAMIRLLEDKSLDFFRKNINDLGLLIARNVDIKMKIVRKDLYEQNIRRWLNFGHTLGHALENLYQLSHGHAVSLGMVAAGYISEARLRFPEKNRLIHILQQYHLPIQMDFDFQQVIELMQGDKKRVGKAIRFVLLEKAGLPILEDLTFAQLENYLKKIAVDWNS